MLSQLTISLLPTPSISVMDQTMYNQTIYKTMYKPAMDQILYKTTMDLHKTTKNNIFMNIITEKLCDSMFQQ